MERLYNAFCELPDQVEARVFPLPHQFQHVDRAFSVTEDAPTIAAVSLVERSRIVMPTQSCMAAVLTGKGSDICSPMQPGWKPTFFRMKEIFPTYCGVGRS